MADYTPPAAQIPQPRHGLPHSSPASDNESSDQITTTTTTSNKPISTNITPSSTSNKKPRGRPPGSKNKPKPPILITKSQEDQDQDKQQQHEQSKTLMRPIVLEISPGSDVIDSVAKFALKRRLGLTVLSGSGTVSNVTLRHPHGPAVSLHGPFSLLSISGSVIVVPSESGSSNKSFSFGICLAGAQGQVFGGVVGGKVIAASSVVVVGATFQSPLFHRIVPGGDDGNEEEEEEDEQIPINCQLASPSSGTDHHNHSHNHQHHVMPGWANNTTRSPYN